MKKQITAVIVGSGMRANIYANAAIEQPDRLKIVGVVEPDEVRRKAAKEKYGIPEENCFEFFEQFVQREKFADAVINGTMDKLHAKTSVPVLEKGYDLLLEKPFAINEQELREVVDAANKNNRKVYICHVLRYAPFYEAIKKLMIQREIGDVISIEMCEHISYSHMVASYVRGKWASPAVCGTPMLLAKSCHDIDIMMWMMNHTKPVSVASFGSDLQFDPKRKPENAGTRCLVDCPIKDDCIYSAEKEHINLNRWKANVWRCLEGEEDTSIERKIELMKTTNPYGRCVWDCERDGNVDHQSVMVQFANGATGTFSMVGGAAKAERNIHIVGTNGEIKGTFEDSVFVVRHMRHANDGIWHTEQKYDLGIIGDMIGENGGHGNGDMRLIYDFLDSLCGDKPSISCTDINDSQLSHLVVFAAERAMENGSVERIVY